MSDPRLIAEISNIVQVVAKIAPEVAVTPDARLVEDLGLDSLSLVEVVMKVEDRFGISVDDDDMPRLQRVSELASYVADKRAAVAA